MDIKAAVKLVQKGKVLYSKKCDVFLLKYKNSDCPRWEQKKRTKLDWSDAPRFSDLLAEDWEVVEAT